MAGVIHILILSAVGVLQIAGCPPGWGLQYDDSCYTVSAWTLTWPDAQAACSHFGGSLAEIETSGEDAFIAEALQNVSAREAWLGATDMFSEGNYIWSLSFDTLTYKNFRPPNPDNYGSAEDCLTTVKSGSIYQWNDADCTKRTMFICEFEYVQVLMNHLEAFNNTGQPSGF